ncbi:Eukaryotic translation initiation factor 4 gamma OS=Schizosaccharomyces pombe (strain 972 / ATCC 24843) GN=tif471 PE=1 SV=1 [Rhizoctonia solani AG-1 IB]|uniref:Eukaryotic translation initiation factor 4 gamma n=1 Tax=Thanatephorus cucumeris (strain AG1-IB / isolate 7/3/14) TaxID=1108050 RepID=A0A0B7F369_THACB|nr:Eukaryotic translation initiation factor 4 gamma OS=Schizosaccharomyces pombe (strain 972 / ATCC 24843) GN=tif471 PE=1 SV=1 [Rhizoctonia solani AG-1 IB]
MVLNLRHLSVSTPAQSIASERVESPIPLSEISSPCSNDTVTDFGDAAASVQSEVSEDDHGSLRNNRGSYMHGIRSMDPYNNLKRISRVIAAPALNSGVHRLQSERYSNSVHPFAVVDPSQPEFLPERPSQTYPQHKFSSSESSFSSAGSSRVLPLPLSGLTSHGPLPTNNALAINKREKRDRPAKVIESQAGKEKKGRTKPEKPKRTMEESVIDCPDDFQLQLAQWLLDQVSTRPPRDVEAATQQFNLLISQIPEQTIGDLYTRIAELIFRKIAQMQPENFENGIRSLSELCHSLFMFHFKQRSNYSERILLIHESLFYMCIQSISSEDIAKSSIAQASSGSAFIPGATLPQGEPKMSVTTSSELLFSLYKLRLISLAQVYEYMFRVVGSRKGSTGTNLRDAVTGLRLLRGLLLEEPEVPWKNEAGELSGWIDTCLNEIPAKEVANATDSSEHTHVAWTTQNVAIKCLGPVEEKEDKQDQDKKPAKESKHAKRNKRARKKAGQRNESELKSKTQEEIKPTANNATQAREVKQDTQALEAQGQAEDVTGTRSKLEAEGIALQKPADDTEEKQKMKSKCDRIFQEDGREIGEARKTKEAAETRAESELKQSPPVIVSTEEKKSAKEGEKQEEEKGRNIIGERYGKNEFQSTSSLAVNLEPVVPLKKSENRWVAGRYLLKRQRMEKHIFVARRTRALLNKLTMENFDPISDRIIELANISEQERNGTTLMHVIKLVFERAKDEAAFSEMYARLCRKMMQRVSPNVQDETIRNSEGQLITGGMLFRKYLLNRCQEDFERGWSAKEAALAATALKAGEDKVAEPASTENGELVFSDEYYAAAKAKRQGLGLVRFVGELFKVQMLTERVMHECIKKLLSNAVSPEEEEIESLCVLLKTAGQILDSPKAKNHMDIYFERMQEIVDSSVTSARMRFILQASDPSLLSCEVVLISI